MTSRLRECRADSIAWDGLRGREENGLDWIGLDWIKYYTYTAMEFWAWDLRTDGTGSCWNETLIPHSDGVWILMIQGLEGGIEYGYKQQIKDTALTISSIHDH